MLTVEESLMFLQQSFLTAEQQDSPGENMYPFIKISVADYLVIWCFVVLKG